MKKLYLSLIVIALFSAKSFAQIEVYSNNNVGIGTSSIVSSMLSVNHTGSSSWTSYFFKESTDYSTGAIWARKDKPIGGGTFGYGIYGYIPSGDGKAIAIKGKSYSGTAYSSGRAYGIRGEAGNATDGWNYGVYGQLLGSNEGAGVYGTLYDDRDVGGRYAGYFYGNTKIIGTLYVNSTSYTSDKNAKKEIKDLEKGNIEKLKQLKAKKYKYKTPKELGINESGSMDTTVTEMATEMQEFYNKEHVGLIAQELQEVYPELVSEDQEGYLGIDYNGLIPILLEAIKEQQTTIEELADEVDKLKKQNE